MSNLIEGHVASVNADGDLVTDISIEQIINVPRDESVRIIFGGHETIGLYPDPHDQPAATMVAKLSNSGFLEVGIVGISLSEMLGINVGEPVKIEW
ncbi:MAG: adenosylmethionine-8-amino-7-oxononanoate aminotransferase [Mariniblastus sp.]